MRIIWDHSFSITSSIFLSLSLYLWISDPTYANLELDCPEKPKNPPSGHIRRNRLSCGNWRGPWKCHKISYHLCDRTKAGFLQSLQKKFALFVGSVRRLRPEEPLKFVCSKYLFCLVRFLWQDTTSNSALLNLITAGMRHLQYFVTAAR